MIFKITPRFNLVSKILAFVLLLLEIVKTILVFSDASLLKPNFAIIYMIAEVFFIFTCLYIVAVLRFFNEKKMISTSFIIFTIIDLLLVVCSLILFHIQPQNIVFIYSIISFITLLASAYIFIMSFFIRQKAIFGPVLMFALSMLALELLYHLVPFVLPLLNRLVFNMLIGEVVMRRIYNCITPIIIVFPIATIWLINCVDKFIRSGQGQDITSFD